MMSSIADSSTGSSSLATSKPPPPPISRHDITLPIKRRPMTDFPSEIMYMQQKQKYVRVLDSSSAFKHRLKLVQSLAPRRGDDAGLSQTLERESQEAAQPASDPLSQPATPAHKRMQPQSEAQAASAQGHEQSVRPAGATPGPLAQSTATATSKQSATPAHRRVGELSAQPDDSTPMKVSGTRTLTSQHSTGVINAAKLGETLEKEADGRAYDELIQIMPPVDSEAKSRIRRLYDLLESGGHRQEDSNPPNATAPIGNPVVACMAELAQDVRRGQAEEFLETGLAKLLNAIALQLASTIPPEQDGEAWSRGIPGKGTALFVSHGRSAVRDNRGDVTMRDKSDMVGLLAEEAIPVGFRANTSAMASWLELKKTTSADLSRDLFQQILRYEFRNVAANAAVGRGYGLTMCGRLLRLWEFDASGYTTSRAIDILRHEDLLDLTLTLAFLAGPTNQLVQRWQPPAGEALLFCDPAPHAAAASPKGQPCIRVKLKGFLQPLNDASLTGLFGRRTAVWGGEAHSIEKGWLIDGDFVRDDAQPVKTSVSVIVKTSWLPPYLVDHEHCVLDRLQQRGVENVPRPLGLLHQPATGGLPRQTHQRIVTAPRPTAEATSLEPKSAQLHFATMLMESETGMIMPVNIDEFPMRARVVALRAVFAILFAVSDAGVHYRDINRGNILLKPDWQARLQSCDPKISRDIVILIDFGNSRILDQHRGTHLGRVACRLPLGLDDVLSVNQLFMTANAGRCFAMRRTYRNFLQKPEIDDFDREDMAELQDNLAKLDHRYVDDMESAKYCFLYLIELCPTADIEWIKELDDLIRFRKEELWEGMGWNASVAQPAHQVGTIMTEDLSKVLSKVRRKIFQTQKKIRGAEDPNERAVELTPLERETFEFAIAALDDWLRKNPGTNEEAGPAVEPVSSTSTTSQPAPPSPSVLLKSTQAADEFAANLEETRKDLQEDFIAQERLRRRDDFAFPATLAHDPATLLSMRTPTRVPQLTRLSAKASAQSSPLARGHDSEESDGGTECLEWPAGAQPVLTSSRTVRSDTAADRGLPQGCQAPSSLGNGVSGPEAIGGRRKRSRSVTDSEVPVPGNSRLKTSHDAENGAD